MFKKVKKIIIPILIGCSGIIILGIIIITPILMVLDFFGLNTTDNYVENNMDYADRYKEAINIALRLGKGYVPLNRVLYFYLENEDLSFYEIYEDNLDPDTNKMLPISDVCSTTKYMFYDVCKEIDEEQIDEEINKPFIPPIDVKKITVTSFFMEDRVVFGEENTHGGWDFACGNKTPVRAVCDGKITKVSFPYEENKTDKSGGGGNQIYLECEVDDDITYKVRYAHLYPGSTKVEEGQYVLAGQELAGVGTTGYSTGPHLHYQVIFEGNNVDGMSLIDFNDTELFNNVYGGVLNVNT